MDLLVHQGKQEYIININQNSPKNNVLIIPSRFIARKISIFCADIILGFLCIIQNYIVLLSQHDKDIIFIIYIICLDFIIQPFQLSATRLTLQFATRDNNNQIQTLLCTVFLLQLIISVVICSILLLVLYLIYPLSIQYYYLVYFSSLTYGFINPIIYFTQYYEYSYKASLYEAIQFFYTISFSLYYNVNNYTYFISQSMLRLLIGFIMIFNSYFENDSKFQINYTNIFLRYKASFLYLSIKSSIINGTIQNLRQITYTSFVFYQLYISNEQNNYYLFLKLFHLSYFIHINEQLMYEISFSLSKFKSQLKVKYYLFLALFCNYLSLALILCPLSLLHIENLNNLKYKNIIIYECYILLPSSFSRVFQVICQNKMLLLIQFIQGFSVILIGIIQHMLTDFATKDDSFSFLWLYYCSFTDSVIGFFGFIVILIRIMKRDKEYIKMQNVLN